MLQARGDQERSEPSAGDLLAALARDTGILVRQEIQLASAEMTTKAKTAAVHVGLLGTGGALAHAGLLALIGGLILGLGVIIPMWLSALVIGAVMLCTGYGLVRHGLSALRRIDPIPEQAVATLKDDTSWVKEQLHGHR
jgi:hypothetical protein